MASTLWRWPSLCLVLLCVFCVGPPLVSGNPCVDGTHSCEVSSQRCVPDNSTDNFTCQCLRTDQQLDHFFICTDIPDSQILYLTTPVDTTNSNRFLILEVLSDPSLSQETLRNLFLPLANISSYKDVKFLEFRGLGVVPDLSTTIYALLFTQNVTSDIRHAVAQAILLFEEDGVIRSPNEAVVEIAGQTGVFDTEENTRNDQDDMDWCSFPSLYSCRNNSACRDVALRYDCPCDPGYVDDGTDCYECVDEFHYGVNCTEPCNCVINNTVSCDRVNGTCFCKDHWEGERCDRDVNECARGADVCGDTAFLRCVNLVEGFQCACAEGMRVDEVTGECRGAVITAPLPFDTDGTRDLHLRCEVSSGTTEVTQYEWSDVCLQAEGNRCTIRPQPPWDDGKKVTCTARLASGLSYTAAFVLDLNYPPPSAPLLEGYRSGDRLPAGDNLMMTCSVIGGKPLASGVLFSCPRHRPVSPDVVSANGVTSVLAFQLTSADDRTVCTCSASWKSRSWYTLSSTVVLRVGGGGDGGGGSGDADPSLREALDFKWYILFGSFGVFSIVAIILIVIICRKQAPSRYFRSPLPSTQNTSAGSASIGTHTTSQGQTTGTGSSLSRLDQLSPVDSRRIPGNDQRLAAPPTQHVWRPRRWPSVNRSSSAENLSSWSVGRQTGADGERQRRRNSLSREPGVYDQIGGGVTDFVPSGDTSDMYLHPPGVARPPPGYPYPYLTPQHLEQAHPPESLQAATTGARREMPVPPTGAGNDPDDLF